MTLSPGSGLVLSLALALSAAPRSCGPDQPAQDARDQERLREIFSIPGDARLLSYTGFPPSMGFGQREGLSLAACYLLGGEQTEAFLAAAGSSGWRPLPIPPEVLEAIPFTGLEVPLDLPEGFYTCRTAGDNVLWAAETRPVEEAVSVRDLVLGVLDTRTNRLYVQVKSGY